MTEPMMRIVMAAQKLIAETMEPYERTDAARRALVPYPMIDELAAALHEAGITIAERKRRR